MKKDTAPVVETGTAEMKNQGFSISPLALEGVLTAGLFLIWMLGGVGV